MKKTSKIISVFLIVVMLAGIALIAPVTAGAAVPAWKTAYINYIKNYQYKPEYGGYGLVDLDKNGIPELIIHSGFSAGGGTVTTYYNNKLSSQQIYGYGTIYFLNNMYYVPSGRMGGYYDRVFRVNGVSKLVFDGAYVAKDEYDFIYDNPDDFNYMYRLNGSSNYINVSYEDYQAKFDSIFDLGKATEIELRRCYNYHQVIREINNYVSPPVAPNVGLSNNAAGIYAGWNKVANAAKYNVFYRKASDSKWSSFQTTSNKAQLKGLKSGTLYYVQVQGVTYLGKKGYYSKVKSMTFLAQTKITSIDYNGINTIKYNSVGGANKYQIARLKTGDKGYTYSITTSTSFSEYATCGIAYTYQVRPMYATQNSGTAYGAWSPSKSIGTLIVPTLALSNKGKAVVANWNSVPEAVKYEVYFKSASASKWSMVTTTKTTLPITGVVSGTTYYVQVRPIGNKVSGRYSAVKSIRYYTTVMPILH